MPTASRTRCADPALEAVRVVRHERLRVEVAELVAVLDWATGHELSDADAVTARQGLRLGGEGCPVVDEYDAWDLSCVLGLSPDSCVAYLGNALELRHRLPRLWQRVTALEVPIWKAFRIATETQQLPAAGAEQVDASLAFCAESVSWAQVERTVASALARWCPDEAERRRLDAADGRFLDVHLRGARETLTTLQGTVEVTGTLDLADALDLDTALTHTAAQLATLGSTESLDVRRSQALGEIARAQLALDLDGAAGRAVTIVAHVSDADAVAFVDNTQTPIGLQHLLDWCSAAGTRVTIKPVVDLAADLSSAGYRPSPSLREQVDLRDHRCVFPYCQRRRTDHDHVVAHAEGGPTTSHNLARLCRAHHRAKTHSAWTYETHTPGVYHWTSPTGLTYLVDRTHEP